MPHDEFESDAALAAALETADRNTSARSASRPGLDTTTSTRPRVAISNDTPTPKVVQPKPQALPTRSGPNSILVSPRQKGNPILTSIRSVPWEYSDILPDYVLGVTTCALFLSLKYHRLHPEYIYNRIQKLAGKYNLRIVLTMVDIPNHEEALRELSKTSLINNVTIILTWSAQEAGHYLELFKTYEHAPPTSIRAQQSNSYSDKMIEFITTPRSVNKTDAIGLVSNFGSIRTAINANPEEVALIAGWGEKKVQRWCNSVREPFRVRKTAKRVVSTQSSHTVSNNGQRDAAVAARLGIGPPTIRPGATEPSIEPAALLLQDQSVWQPGADEEEAMMQAESEAAMNQQKTTESSSVQKRKKPDEELEEGVMAALAKLRQKK